MDGFFTPELITLFIGFATIIAHTIRQSLKTSREQIKHQGEHNACHQEISRSLKNINGKLGELGKNDEDIKKELAKNIRRTATIQGFLRLNLNGHAVEETKPKAKSKSKK